MSENTAPNFSDNSSQSSNSGRNPDFAAIIALARAITLDPVKAWPMIKARQESISDVYRNYLIYLAAIPAVCGFIGQVVVGISIPFYGTWRPSVPSALFTSLINYAVSLAGVYIMAMIAERLSPMFDGKASREDSFKLIAYALTPGYLAGVLSLIPVLGFLSLFAFLYSLYVYFKGIAPMGASSEDKNMSFFFVSAGCFILAGIVIGMVQAFMTPTPELPAELMKNLESLGR